MNIRTLGIDDLDLIRSIDRSEHVDVEYHVVDGRLTERPVTMADIPPWQLEGDDPWSVAAKIEFCRECALNGAALLGAFDDDNNATLGIAVMDVAFASPMAWLAFLHVTRPARRRGTATALWDAAADIARRSGAETIYVSAVPTGSAVGFYLRQSCQLADPVHPALWAKEPDDIHLVCSLR